MCKAPLKLRPYGAVEISVILFYFILVIYLFAQETTIITVTKLPVHELDKKANKPALTILLINIIGRYIRITSKVNQSVNQSINQSVSQSVT